MKYVRESKVETHFKDRVESELDGIAEKHLSPGRRGVPDRLVTLHGGFMFLVELKAPKGKTKKWQERDHELRRRRGVTVYVCHTVEQCDRLIENWKLLL